ncbi:MAG: OadG family protein [Dehalococcoidia bacterium]
MNSDQSVLMDGLYVTSVGMLTVFVILILIFISIKIVIRLTLVSKNSTKSLVDKDKDVLKITTPNVNISESQIAAIAVAYILSESEENFDDFQSYENTQDNPNTWWSNGNQRTLHGPTTQYL